MKRARGLQPTKPPLILVVDVGGSHVKCLVTGETQSRKFRSGPDLTAEQMVDGVKAVCRGWRFTAVTIGYPGVVRNNAPVNEPQNLGIGWVGFDYSKAFGCPVKIVNDAAMQALGAYDGGKMLFLGLGTGLGSALIVDGIIIAMELGHLECGTKRTYEDLVGHRGLKRLGEEKWRRKVLEVMEGFRRALLPDYVVLGGGNSARMTRLPAGTRRCSNAAAFRGGFRLWDVAKPQPRAAFHS
jgi:predicted NBD/HSP70 family sugar kinase